ncbi:monooxygenase Coq6 [Schizosaccharomyces japonicus yFS275]|uniref:Ubiquinone biosynthesis monooxygenase COQ6, mitochondrial n=1 Tax=Schizosaccharomyces japonicus (strain yFS275 / FY16936) TaxID=402676 RepID=B6K5M4_SCHJY|nr:monooxygenase Coq6 [Schizosaccharomyces japonicus yFS275]EEB08828.1 monooxygenase Coq6 [Schizosaccharomyces japonicus yFS275]
MLKTVLHRATVPQRMRFATAASSNIHGDSCYDITIVGAGAAGLALATALKAKPETRSLKIAVVDRLKVTDLENWTPTNFSNRCSSVVGCNREFMKEIGAWENVRHDRIQPFRHVQAWDGITDSVIHLDQTDKNDSMAFMTENVNILSAFVKTLLQYNGSNPVDFIMRSNIENITLDPETKHPVLTIANVGTISTKLLVGADGRNSLVRSAAGIELPGWSYNTSAVVGTLSIEAPDDPCIGYQRFLPTGPIAFLPLPGNNASFVWSTRPHIANFLLQLPAPTFVHMLNASFRLREVDLEYLYKMDPTKPEPINEQIEWRLNMTVPKVRPPPLVTSILPKSRAAFPLRLAHADTYVKERLALIGDAAHNTHPLAGQGLNSGLRDAKSLANALTFAVEHGQDVGSMFSLQPYVRERYYNNHYVLGIVDKFHKLYTTKNPFVVGIRSLGVSTLDILKPIKKRIVRNVSAGL